MPAADSKQVTAGNCLGLVDVHQLVIELVGGEEVGIISVFHHIDHVTDAQRVGAQRRIGMADAGQVDKASRGCKGRIKLQAILRPVHEVRGAQELGIASKSKSSQQQ